MFILNIFDKSLQDDIKCDFQQWITNNNILQYAYNINQIFVFSLIDKILKEAGETNANILYNMEDEIFYSINGKFSLFLLRLFEKLDSKIYIQNPSKNFHNKQRKEKVLHSIIMDEKEYVQSKRRKILSLQMGNSLNLHFLASKWNGITVIPDIHGDRISFENSVSWALSNNNFMIFLGDLLRDIKEKNNIFCNENIGIIKLVYDIVHNGQGLLCPGNHDIVALKNFMRYLHNNEISKSYDEEETDLESRKIEIILKFLYFISRSRSFYYLDVGEEKFIFSHASFYQNALHENKNAIQTRIENSNIIYGNYIIVDNVFKDDLSWTNTIEKDQTCFVGHTITNFFSPTRIENEKGGKIYLLDTGCGKNGSLTVADLSFTKEGDSIRLKLRNYKKFINENKKSNLYGGNKDEL